MFSAKLLVLLAAVASAQSSGPSATILNFGLLTASTITLKGSSAGTTTYAESCTRGVVTKSYTGLTNPTGMRIYICTLTPPLCPPNHTVPI